MSITLKYTNHWPDREPSLHKSTATKADVLKLIDKINWNQEAAMYLKNKRGIEIFIEGSIDGGLIVSYTEKSKIYGTTDEPFLEDIIAICTLFADGKKTWKNHMEFIYDRNVDGTVDIPENSEEEKLIQSFTALNITHGYFGRDYEEIDGVLDVTNLGVVFINNYNYADGIHLHEIVRFETDRHMLIDNVMILYNAQNMYYKFVIKGGQRDTAIKVIKKAIKANKKAIDKNIKEKEKTEKEIIRQLCKDVISINNIISKNYIISDCQKCNSEKFVLIDVNPTGTGIEVQCENCEKSNWIKIINDNAEANKLSVSFTRFNELDPFFYYQYLTAYIDYNNLPKAAQKDYKKELPLMKEAHDLLDIVRNDDGPMEMESIEVFQIYFLSSNFNNTDIKDAILDVLRDGTKMGVNEIHQRIDSSDVETIRMQCESLYIDNSIQRTKNYRYFIGKQPETISKHKKSSSNSDYSELKELKLMLDDGLITKDDYEKKKKEILGL